MCNLYRNSKGADEVAARLDAEPQDIATLNTPEIIYPTYPAMIVREFGNRRVLQSMTWGFPRRVQSMKQSAGPRAVNTVRADRLHSHSWKPSFLNRRCLVPATAWAEAEGERGRRTRTWYSLADADLFAIAGIWRPTDEWGDAYAMVLVDGYARMAHGHDRMPAIVRAEDCERWMKATPKEASELIRASEDELVVERTVEPWHLRRSERRRCQRVPNNEPGGVRRQQSQGVLVRRPQHS